MNAGPKNRSDMIHLLHAAMDQSGSTTADRTIEDEHIALLAEGRLDELPESDRQHLLRQVASDPQIAQVLREVRQLIDAPAAGTRQGISSQSFMRFTQYAWAAAACLFLTLGLWRMVDPSAPLQRGPDQSVHILQNQPAGSTDYWQMHNQQQLKNRLHQDELRDWALIISSGVCVILANPVVLIAVRGLLRKP